MTRAGVAALLSSALLLAGCTGTLVPARVPEELLQGSGGNGWEPDPAHTDGQPRSESLGLVQRQTLAYADDARGGNGGYPASLALTTLKLLPAPSEAQLRDILREQVRERSEASGIRLGAQVVEGARTLGDGHRTLFFVFDGNVTGTGPLFTTRDAASKILGEVWNCPESGTSVAAVGLAQVSTVRSVGGVPLPAEQDARNWRELAADPQGGVDGQRGADGLLYNARCSA